MKKTVCERFCTFYKPDRDEPQKCGTYDFLRKNLTEGEVESISRITPREIDRSCDGSIRDMVCAKCDFLADGCDYRAGVDSPPCGGYTIIAHMLK